MRNAWYTSSRAIDTFDIEIIVVFWTTRKVERALYILTDMASSFKWLDDG